MKLVDVYTCPAAAFILFNLLAEREPHQNISHKKMPTMDEHMAFVYKKPYPHWYLIETGGIIAGATYLTEAREVGIFIFREHQRKGIARRALALLADTHPGPMMATINPKNAASITLFEGLGFAHIQNTYAK